ncbi:hypothetical protein UFVDC4_00014 [Staphylococcus phage vB_SauM-UFV_DC4]|nr:hypothetical protein UFVDC4_00014 [Staphylococcus phage vB_SauM-UFV_DC4]
MDMSKAIKDLFINYNISYIEVNEDHELNEIDKEELLKILDFDIKFEKEEILISDNIKINNFNGNKLINFVFNYYYTDNESLKVFLKDVIKDIILYGYKEDRKISLNISQLPLVFYINKFCKDNGIKNIKFHYTFKNSYGNFSFGLLKEEHLDEFIDDIEEIRNNKFFNLNSGLLDNDLIINGNEKKFMKLISSLIDLDMSHKGNIFKLKMINYFYKLFNSYINSEEDLEYADELMKFKIDSLKYGEFNKYYLYERFIIGIDNLYEQEFLGYNTRMNYNYFIDKIQKIEDEDEVKYISKIVFFTLIDDIYKEASFFLSFRTVNKYTDIAVKEILKLIEDNLTENQKKQFVREYMSMKDSSFYASNEKYNQTSTLVKMSKGKLKKLIMNETVKKTFI